jgi:hypothetical protein
MTRISEREKYPRRSQSSSSGTIASMRLRTASAIVYLRRGHRNSGAIQVTYHTGDKSSMSWFASFQWPLVSFIALALQYIHIRMSTFAEIVAVHERMKRWSAWSH